MRYKNTEKQQQQNPVNNSLDIFKLINFLSTTS